METMQVFGDYDHLAGWYCQPSAEAPGETAVVMLTAGMLHHVGPMRLHVQLARELASRGVASLRYNLSGIGESLAVAAPGSSLARAADELGQALDWLQAEYGHKHFVLFGLCSGADDALAAAVSEQRVIGLSLMDGCGFRTPQFYPHWFRLKYWPKLRNLHKWRALSWSCWQKLVPGCAAQGQASSMPLGQDIREFADVQTCQTQVSCLLERQVALQWIYTGGAIDYYAYPGQFFDMFPKLSPCDLLSIQHLPQIDHLASLRADREQVLHLVSNWCVERLGRCAPRVSTPATAPAVTIAPALITAPAAVFAPALSVAPALSIAPGITAAPTAHLYECG